MNGKEKEFIEKATTSLYTKLFVGIFSIAAAVITIFAFFQEKKVDLQYEILSNANVLDINAEISKLDIIYDSTSLKENNENLRLINIKVINKGSKHILKEYLDYNDPIGIRIDSGKILENPEIIETSNEYIKRNLKYDLHSDCTITFSEIIIESGEYFVVKLLVLHKTNEEPQIHSLGKIAGQRQIEIRYSTDIKDEIPFFEATYFGNVWIQIVRFISYFFLIVLILLIIAFIASKTLDLKTNRKRKRIINKFKENKNYKYSKMDDAIFDRYFQSGPDSFEEMLELTTDVLLLNEKYQEALDNLKQRDEKTIDTETPTPLLHIKDEASRILTIIRSMQKDGLVYTENENLIINQKMRMTLGEFVDLLKVEKEFMKQRFYRGGDVISVAEESIE